MKNGYGAYLRNIAEEPLTSLAELTTPNDPRG
jgi:hypothetical protein